MANFYSIDAQLLTIQDLGYDVATLAHAAASVLEGFKNNGSEEHSHVDRLLYKLEALGNKIAAESDPGHVRQVAERAE